MNTHQSTEHAQLVRLRDQMRARLAADVAQDAGRFVTLVTGGTQRRVKLQAGALRFPRAAMPGATRRSPFVFSEPGPKLDDKAVKEARDQLAERVAELEKTLAEMARSNVALSQMLELLKREKQLLIEKQGETVYREELVRQAQDEGAEFTPGRIRQYAAERRISIADAFAELQAWSRPQAETFSSSATPSASAVATKRMPAFMTPEEIKAAMKEHGYGYEEAFAYLMSKRQAA